MAMLICGRSHHFFSLDVNSVKNYPSFSLVVVQLRVVHVQLRGHGLLGPEIPAGWWYTYTSEKYESVEVGMMKFPIFIWKDIQNSMVPVTTNQPSYKYVLTTNKQNPIYGMYNPIEITIDIL